MGLEAQSSAVSGSAVYYFGNLSANLLFKSAREGRKQWFKSLDLVLSSCWPLQATCLSVSRIKKHWVLTWSKSSIAAELGASLHLGNFIPCIFVDNSICKSLIILNDAVPPPGNPGFHIKGWLEGSKACCQFPTGFIKLQRKPRGFFGWWIAVIERSAIYLHQCRSLGLQPQL